MSYNQMPSHIYLEDLSPKDIWYPNFAGKPDNFNREGNRNFKLRLYDQELIDRLEADGWRIEHKAPKTPDQEELVFIKCNVNFNSNQPPEIVQVIEIGDKKKFHTLTEDEVHILDRTSTILSFDLDLSPYRGKNSIDGKYSAYVNEMYFVREVSRFALKYGWTPEEAEDSSDDEEPLPF